MPSPDGALGTQAIQAKAEAFAANVRPTVSELRGRGLSYRAVASELTKRGFMTPRGGMWTDKLVMKILAA